MTNKNSPLIWIIAIVLLMLALALLVNITNAGASSSVTTELPPQVVLRDLCNRPVLCVWSYTINGEERVYEGPCDESCDTPVCPQGSTPMPTEEPTPGVDPTATPEPPTPVEPAHCNRGNGNGSEGCDPGNSGGRPGNAGEDNE